MRRWQLVLLVAGVVSWGGLGVVPALAEASAGDIITFKDQDITKMHINGMGQGLLWANVLLKQRGNTPLYCQPAQLGMTPEQYIAILEDYVKGDAKRREAPAPLMLLIALQRVFPCS